MLGVLVLQAHTRAEADSTTQAAAADLYDQRDGQALLANVLFGVGGAVGVVGAVVLGLGLLGGD